MVAGVCAGLGRYFDLDPVVFRVPLAVLSAVGGLGLVFYGAAWLLLPAEGERQNEARWLLSGRVEGTTLSAILVALIGCGLFLASLGSRSTPSSLLLIGAVGGAAYWSQHRREAEAAEAVGAPVDPTTAHAVADAPPETQAPPVPGTPSWWREPLTKDGTAAPRDTGYLWGPEDGDIMDDEQATAYGAFRRRGPVPAGRRRERSFGGLTTLLASGAAVLGALPGWDSRPLGTSLTLGLACALAVYGIAYVISSFAGRIGFGGLFLAVVTAVMLMAASLIPESIGTDWGRAEWAPSSAAEVSRTYRLDGGAAELDLTRLRSDEDRGTVRTKVHLGVGRLKIVVPADTRVELTAHLGGGELRLPTQTDASGNDFVVERSRGLDRHEKWSLPAVGTANGQGDDKENGDGDGDREGNGAGKGRGDGNGAQDAKGSGSGGKEKRTLELSLDMILGQAEIVRLLPTGERTDHLPGRQLPYVERVGDDRRNGTSSEDGPAREDGRVRVSGTFREGGASVGKRTGPALRDSRGVGTLREDPEEVM